MSTVFTLDDLEALISSEPQTTKVRGVTVKRNACLDALLADEDNVAIDVSADEQAYHAERNTDAAFKLSACKAPYVKLIRDRKLTLYVRHFPLASKLIVSKVPLASD